MNNDNREEQDRYLRLSDLETIIKTISKYPTIEKRWFTAVELDAYMTMEPELQSKYREAKHIGRIPYTKPGRMVRYDKEDIDEWLCSHKVHSLIS